MTRTQMVLSLISGLMLGVALLHLIPHAFDAGQAIDTVMIWTLFGLIFMLLLLRWFHFNQHDFASAAADCKLASADEHHHAHAHDHAHFGAGARCRWFVRGVVCAHSRRWHCPRRSACWVSAGDINGRHWCLFGDTAAQAAGCVIY
jgi:hypothetical protein